MSNVIDFQKRVREAAEEETLEEMTLPPDEALEIFVAVLMYLRILSISNKAKIIIEPDTLTFETENTVEGIDGEMGVEALTTLLKTSVAEITDEDGELYSDEGLRDIIKEMFLKLYP